MTREDINDIINAICPNDEDYEKPCISPKYLRQELEQLALDQKQWNGDPTTKNDLGVDCIDRQATLDAIIKRLGIRNESYLLPAERTIYQQIKDMPLVTPEEPFINKPCVSSGVCEHDKQIVLDKIRAEVTALKSHHINDSYDDGFQGCRIEVLDILDKYKAESED